MRRPFTQPPVDEQDYLPRDEHYKLLSEAYRAGVSSRVTPTSYPSFPAGTWRIDGHSGAYGRGIEELVEFHPRELTPGEFDWRDPRAELRHGGKWEDALRYAKWLSEGLEPPPIEVVATNGQLRVGEGHRRLVAADIAGRSIKAWVSWSVPQPEGHRDAATGVPIPVGLTYELAHPRRAANADSDSFTTGEPVAYGPLSGGAYAYRLAHALETTSACGTGADDRSRVRTGALRVRLEDGVVIDLDCDNFTPLRRLFEDPELVDDIAEEASRPLRELLDARVPNPDEPPVMRGRMMQSEFDPTGWWGSEKLDGVRGWWEGGVLRSRKGNVFAAPDWFTEGWPKDVVMDGELFGGRGNFNESSGIVRRHKPHRGWKKIVYFVFDLPTHPGTYEERMEALDILIDKIGSPYLAAVPRIKFENKDQLQLALEKIEQAHGEGLVIVAPGSKYVGAKTGNVLKVKRFHDAEGVVFDYEPGKGRLKGSVGALWLRDADGLEFKVGPGMTDVQRKNARKLFPRGTLVTYRFFERAPSGKPRFASFVRVRAEEPEARAANVGELKARLLAP